MLQERTTMSNIGITLVKISLLAGGAVLGAMLSQIIDQQLMKRSEEQSERDKSRYAQGLSPKPKDL
jgi:hypothetical protein